MNAQGGRRVAVAALSKELIGRSIEPLPGTVIYVMKQSGRVVVALTATDAPVAKRWNLHWMEHTGGFTLNNLLKAGIAPQSR